jgi:proline iminopeptidase
MRSAWDLNKSLPSSKLYVIDSEGHSIKEIGISKKLIELTNELANFSFNP